MMIWVTLGYVDGKRKQKRIYGSTKTELEKNKRAAIAEFESAPVKTTFGEYKEYWFKTYKAVRQAATREMYENAMRKTKSIDDIALTDITTADLQNVINDHINSPRTTAILRQFFGQVFKCAIGEGKALKNPSEGLQLPAQKKSVQRALTQAERDAIRSLDLPPKKKMFIKCLYYLGLRPGECLALHSDDIRNGEVHIHNAIGFDKNMPYLKPTKTQVERIVPIPTEFQDELSDFCNGGYLFAEDGRFLTKSGMYDMWNYIKRGVCGNSPSDIRPYTLRHDYCTRCYYMGLTPLMTAKLMGNSVKMVMEVYSHLDEEKEPLEKLRSMTL